MSFNAEQFMSTVVKGAFDTKTVPIPEGEYPGTITKLDLREVKTKNGDRIILEVTWEITDPAVEQATNRDKNYARQSIWLDVTPEGALSERKGTNIGLGRLREAIGQNNPDKDWNMPQLVGASAMVSIKHRLNETTGEVYGEVGSVRPF
jgi:hypothetical protein